MAEEEVATKAPESDGNDKGIFPADTPAQQGASMGVSIARHPHKPSVAELMSRVRNTV